MVSHSGLTQIVSIISALPLFLWLWLLANSMHHACLPEKGSSGLICYPCIRLVISSPMLGGTGFNPLAESSCIWQQRWESISTEQCRPAYSCNYQISHQHLLGCGRTGGWQHECVADKSVEMIRCQHGAESTTPRTESVWARRRKPPSTALLFKITIHSISVNIDHHIWIPQLQGENTNGTTLSVNETMNPWISFFKDIILFISHMFKYSITIKEGP